MAMTLYHGEPNGPSLTALAALFECGLDAKRVKIDLTKGQRHAQTFAHDMEVALSVEGEGPVVVVDGVAVCDSVFMACMFDDMAGEGKIRPTDPYERWEMMTWCRQIIERVAPAAAYLGTEAYLQPSLSKVDKAEFAKQLELIDSADLRERWKEAQDGLFEREKIDASHDKIVDWLRLIEDHLNNSNWIIGDSFTIADLETYAWIAGMVDIVPSAFDDMHRTHDWMERMRERPSVKKALELSSVDDPTQVWAPGPEINRWG